MIFNWLFLHKLINWINGSKSQNSENMYSKYRKIWSTFEHVLKDILIWKGIIHFERVWKGFLRIHYRRNIQTYNSGLSPVSVKVLSSNSFLFIHCVCIYLFCDLFVCGCSWDWITILNTITNAKSRVNWLPDKDYSIIISERPFSKINIIFLLTILV